MESVEKVFSSNRLEGQDVLRTERDNSTENQVRKEKWNFRIKAGQLWLLTVILLLFLIVTLRVRKSQWLSIFSGIRRTILWLIRPCKTSWISESFIQTLGRLSYTLVLDMYFMTMMMMMMMMFIITIIIEKLRYKYNYKYHYNIENKTNVKCTFTSILGKIFYITIFFLIWDILIIYWVIK